MECNRYGQNQHFQITGCTLNVTPFSMSSSPLVNNLVKNWLFKTAPDIDELPFSIHPHSTLWILMSCHFQFIHIPHYGYWWAAIFNSSTFHTMDLSAVDTMLHDSPDLVVYRTKIWAVWRSQVGRKKVWRFLTQQFNCSTCVAQCAGTLSCWNTKSLPNTMAAVWRHEAAWKKSVRTSPEFHAL